MTEQDRDTRHRVFALGRIIAIARTTFTQLTRMRVFYFLLIFSLMILGVAMMIENFNTDKVRELKVLKDMAFFSMSMFSTVFAIAATAMLLPKDIEDRTLYTILAKPVPRFEYLVGKYLGSMFIILISLIVMTVLLYGILYFRQTAIYNVEAPMLKPDGVAFLERQLAKEGISWNLLNACAAIFLQASVLAATTLLISTFASSTLFTIIVTIIVFFIGYAQPLVIDYWRHAHEIDRFGAALIYLFELAFPNFQNFNIVDGIVAGEQLPFMTLLGITGIAATYVGIYLFAVVLIFRPQRAVMKNLITARPRITAIVLLLLFGVVRLPLENRLGEHLSSLAFHEGEILNQSMRERLGQAGFAAALGGFRSFLATVFEIKAVSAWENTEWDQLESDYNLITQLQPRVSSYWDSAYQHIGLNARSYYRNFDTEHTPEERQRLVSLKIERGKQFLLDGLRYNPKDFNLWRQLAWVYFREEQDFCKASEIFGLAAELPDAMPFARRYEAFLLARCPGREREAYEKLMAVYALGELDRTYEVITEIKRMEEFLNIPEEQRIKDSGDLRLPNQGAR